MALQLSSELVRQVLEAAPDAMVVVDASGTILFANRQVERVFGYPSAELVGQCVDNLLPERFRGRHPGHRRQFGADGRFRPMGAGLELFARRRDGTEFPVEISLSPIEDADRILVAAAIRDVTDRKRIQSELIAAREIADRANLAKSRFLATASHDLRQPLQALALLNGTLHRMTNDAGLTEALQQQDRAIGAMSRLLNALLDISKLESGAIKPEPTDFTVAALLEELRAEFAALAANKGLELQVELCADHVYCDRSLVEQILRNLVSNAIKYTRRGVVRLRCLHETAAVRVQVLDTGIGIASGELPYIYDEFYQVGVAANSVREGFGLGLSIVHRLVKLLDLNLEVQSEVGKGSVFTLDLPPGSGGAVRKHIESPARAAAANVQSAQRPHVLLVEDDPAVLAATRMLLKVDGYRVTTAGSLIEAEEHARENPDIRALVTDYHLGAERTGTEVIASLRSILDPKLRAILVTGDTSRAIKELPPDEGVRVISKPVDVEELLALLRALTTA
ncbi:MAG TPA: PAS domain S-box protein [Steroidobacteraceae bacterium]|jgi:PAS domain S-box-containing protein